MKRFWGDDIVSSLEVTPDCLRITKNPCWHDASKYVVKLSLRMEASSEDSSHDGIVEHYKVDWSMPSYG